MQKKAECLVCYSYQHSNEEVMLVDVQGVGYSLFDPEIALSQLSSNQNEVLFTTGQPRTQALLPTPGAAAKTLVGAGHVIL